jgi:hypothetical protein
MLLHGENAQPITDYPEQQEPEKNKGKESWINYGRLCGQPDGQLLGVDHRLTHRPPPAYPQQLILMQQQFIDLNDFT